MLESSFLFFFLIIQLLVFCLYCFSTAQETMLTGYSVMFRTPMAVPHLQRCCSVWEACPLSAAPLHLLSFLHPADSEKSHYISQFAHSCFGFLVKIVSLLYKSWTWSTCRFVVFQSDIILHHYTPFFLGETHSCKHIHWRDQDLTLKQWKVHAPIWEQIWS